MLRLSLLLFAVGSVIPLDDVSKGEEEEEDELLPPWPKVKLLQYIAEAILFCLLLVSVSSSTFLLFLLLLVDGKLKTFCLLGLFFFSVMPM